MASQCGPMSIFFVAVLILLVFCGCWWGLSNSSLISGFKSNCGDMSEHSTETKSFPCPCSQGPHSAQDDPSHTKGGCMCTNPAYFDLVCSQGERVENFDYIEGLLIDARCYAISYSNYTNDHLIPPSTERKITGCATGCAKSGIPVALLTGPLPPGPGKNNRAYILLHPAPNLSLHMEKFARVYGCFLGDLQAIFTTKVEVKGENGEWKEVSFTTPMSGWLKQKIAEGKE